MWICTSALVFVCVWRYFLSFLHLLSLTHKRLTFSPVSYINIIKFIFLFCWLFSTDPDVWPNIQLSKMTYRFLLSHFSFWSHLNLFTCYSGVSFLDWGISHFELWDTKCAQNYEGNEPVWAEKLSLSMEGWMLRDALYDSCQMKMDAVICWCQKINYLWRIPIICVIKTQINQVKYNDFVMQMQWSGLSWIFKEEKSKDMGDILIII